MDNQEDADINEFVLAEVERFRQELKERIPAHFPGRSLSRMGIGVKVNIPVRETGEDLIVLKYSHPGDEDLADVVDEEEE